MNLNILRAISCFCVVFALVLFGACGKTEKDNKGDIGKTGVPIIDSLSVLIADNPTNANLYAQRAAAFFKRDNCNLAIQDMASALRYDSLNVPFHHQLADLYLDCGQSLLGVRTMERAAVLAPDKIPTLLKLAEFQYIVKQFNPSLATIDQIFKYEPNNAEGYFMLGQNFRELGDTIKAIRCYEKCVAFDSEHGDAYVSLGLLMEKKNNAVALKYFDNALRIDSTNISALYGKAMYHQNRYQDSLALALYHRIAVIDNHFEDAFINSAILYMDAKQWPKALNELTICIKQNPLATRAYYFKGFCLENMGKDSLPSAAANYEIALKQSPSYKEAKDALARLGILK